MKLFLSLLSAACISGVSLAQLLRYKPPDQTGLSYTFGAAHPNVTGGESDLFLQVQGLASQSWIALGQGSSMKGSRMFIIYANAAGTNVTLSPRLSSGHDEPSAETDSEAFLLAGSGIVDGNMMANILCRKCSSWKDGSMNLSGSGQPWIWASKSGDPVRSDSTSANVQQHDDGAYASFKLDLNLISPDNSSNPFLDLSSSQIIDAGDSSAGYDGAAIPIHGVIMCLAFMISFPIGAFLIRLASFRGLVWIHAGVQLLSYFGAIIGLGLGVYIANKGAADLSSFHPIFGIAIVVLLIFQPALGYVHHLQYQRYHRPSPYTRVHVWFGRLLVTAGLIDGLLGLTLAGQSTGTIVAYCIVAGGVWLLWILVIVRATKRQKTTKVQRDDIRLAALVEDRDRRSGELYNGG